MSQADIRLYWQAPNDDFSEMRCKAHAIVREPGKISLKYMGPTEDGGRYEGALELRLNEAPQCFEGHYTIRPAGKGDARSVQDVGFELNGRFIPDDGTNCFFEGVWIEGDVPQQFRLGPVNLQVQVADGRIDPEQLPEALAARRSELLQFEHIVQICSLSLDATETLATFREQLDSLLAHLDALEQGILTVRADTAQWLQAKACEDLRAELEQIVVPAELAHPELATIVANLQQIVLHSGLALIAQWQED